MSDAPVVAPSTQYSISVQVTLDNKPGVLGELATAIGSAGGSIFAVDGFIAKGPELEREMVINCRNVAHQGEVIAAIEALDRVQLHDWHDRTFKMHEGGKIEVLPLCPVGDRDDLYH